MILLQLGTFAIVFNLITSVVYLPSFNSIGPFDKKYLMALFHLLKKQFFKIIVKNELPSLLELRAPDHVKRIAVKAGRKSREWCTDPEQTM